MAHVSINCDTSEPSNREDTAAHQRALESHVRAVETGSKVWVSFIPCTTLAWITAKKDNVARRLNSPLHHTISAELNMAGGVEVARGPRRVWVAAILVTLKQLRGGEEGGTVNVPEIRAEKSPESTHAALRYDIYHGVAWRGGTHVMVNDPSGSLMFCKIVINVVFVSLKPLVPSVEWWKTQLPDKSHRSAVRDAATLMCGPALRATATKSPAIVGTFKENGSNVHER